MRLKFPTTTPGTRSCRSGPFLVFSLIHSHPYPHILSFLLFPKVFFSPSQAFPLAALLHWEAVPQTDPALNERLDIEQKVNKNQIHQGSREMDRPGEIFFFFLMAGRLETEITYSFSVPLTQLFILSSTCLSFRLSFHTLSSRRGIGRSPCLHQAQHRSLFTCFIFCRACTSLRNYPICVSVHCVCLSPSTEIAAP